MSETDPSRRGFLKLTGSALSGSWLATQWPVFLALGQTACSARDKQAVFVHMSPAVAADLAAIAARIIPSDDTPGAAEAGVIYFFDAALGTIMNGAQDTLANGVKELNTRVAKKHPDKRFSDLQPDQQDAMLQTEDQSALFGAVRFLTITGMFSMPSHGGNRDKVGWDLLGFDSQHGWQPPFGFYDAGNSNSG